MVKVLIATLSDMEKTTTLKSILNQLQNPDNVLQGRNELSSAVGHFMCQHLLLEHGIRREHLSTLRQNAYGKWQLPGHSIDFNVSHSNDKVVAAITDQGMVGIDIEEIKSIMWREYEECFNQGEWLILSHSTEPEKTFFDLWTKKESLSKAYGFGLQVPLNKMQVSERISIIQDTNLSGYFHPLFISGYSGYVCSSKKQEFSVHHFLLP